ncbi:MAG: YdcF family protein [Chlorobiales bacterium]|nr:YdcF family protein [Chlorobiales bacterium]
MRKRFFFLFGISALWFFSMPVVADSLMKMVEGNVKRVPVNSVGKADAIVVLSGMLRQVQGAPLGEWDDAADRFEGGIELYKAGKASLLIFTRGQTPWELNAVPEGELLAKRAVMLGVTETGIRLTERVGNTADEAVATWKLLGGRKKKSRINIILVTSAFHMPRAVLLFEEAGFKVVPYRVDYQTDDISRLTVLSYLPHGVSLEKSERALREVIGWAFYWVRGFFSRSFF